MAENTVNTMVISVDKFEQLNNEVSIAKANAEACKTLLVTASENKRLLEKEVEKLQRQVEEEKQVVYVRNDKYGTNTYTGMRLPLNSEVLVDIIKTNLDEAKEQRIKELENKVKSLETDQEVNNLYHERETRQLRSAKIESEFQLNEQIKEITRRYEVWQTEIERNNSDKVRTLKNKLEDLQKDYDDLKLNKAEEVLEAARLEEVNLLKERIAELEVKLNEPATINGFFNKLFHKSIKVEAENIYAIEQHRINWTKKLESPIGKAKSFLKNFINNSYNTPSGYPSNIIYCGNRW